MQDHISFPETFSFRGTRRDRERLETLCRRLEQTSGELLRQLIREKAAQVFVTGQGNDAGEDAPAQETPELVSA